MKSVKKSNKKFAEKLASVPIEYQASVYAKEMELQRQEKQNEHKKNLAEHRKSLKSLERKFQEETSENSRAILLKEIQLQYFDLLYWIIRNKKRQSIYVYPVVPSSKTTLYKICRKLKERNILVRTSAAQSPYIVGLKFSFQTPCFVIKLQCRN